MGETFHVVYVAGQQKNLCYQKVVVLSYMQVNIIETIENLYLLQLQCGLSYSLSGTSANNKN